MSTAAEIYRAAHDAELNTALHTPPPGLDESSARALVERALQRAHRAGRDALVRELVEWGAEAAEIAREREKEERAEAAQAEQRQREAALRDQYGPELGARIELDGIYALVRHQAPKLALERSRMDRRAGRAGRDAGVTRAPGSAASTSRAPRDPSPTSSGTTRSACSRSPAARPGGTPRGRRRSRSPAAPGGCGSTTTSRGGRGPSRTSSS